MTSQKQQATRRVALTGGAGSGKSAAAERFREHGVVVVDSDALAREVVEPGTEGLAALVEVLGADILDDAGTLDRPRLRERMLADAEARRQLEAILHPRIMQALDERLASATGPYAIGEIPLLVESGQGQHFDYIISVEAPMATRLERLMQRDAIDEDAARQLIRAQASEAERRQVADAVLENNADLAHLHRQVDQLHRQLTHG